MGNLCRCTGYLRIVDAVQEAASRQRAALVLKGGRHGPRCCNPEKVPHPIGDSVPRVDAHEKVLGAALFADDIQFGPGLLYRPHQAQPAPARADQAHRCQQGARPAGREGGGDRRRFPRHDRPVPDRPHIFCRDRVRYVGDPVAGVAAISEEIAEQAVDLIEVEYEVAARCLRPGIRRQPGSAAAAPRPGQYEVANFIFPEPGTNISNHFRIRKGDVDGAWAQCAAIVERNYRIPHIQHVPIEPHVAVAKVEENGKVTLWGSSQSPFAQRNLIAKALGISQSDVQVIAPYVGGGFGCKAGVSMEALAVAIAMKVKGRPVKLRLTREEEFYTAFVRQGLVAHFKMGCDKDGTLAGDGEPLLLGWRRLHRVRRQHHPRLGLQQQRSVRRAQRQDRQLLRLHQPPGRRADARLWHARDARRAGAVHRRAGAMRSGWTRCEFRKLNCVQTGDILVTGMMMHPTGLSECLEKAAEAIGWGRKDPPSAPQQDAAARASP